MRLTRYLRLGGMSLLSHFCICHGTLATSDTPHVAVSAGQPDLIQENFGARAAPYEGFLVLPGNSIPPGYVEVSHHYTKREYLLKLEKSVRGERFGLEIVESDLTNFIEPSEPVLKEFVYEGCPGRIYSYHDQLTGKEVISLYWLNAPKQRLSISADRAPPAGWSPDDLIGLLHALVMSTDKSPLIEFQTR